MNAWLSLDKCSTNCGHVFTTGVSHCRQNDANKTNAMMSAESGQYKDRKVWQLQFNSTEILYLCTYIYSITKTHPTSRISIFQTVVLFVLRPVYAVMISLYTKWDQAIPHPASIPTSVFRWAENKMTVTVIPGPSYKGMNVKRLCMKILKFCKLKKKKNMTILS